MGFLSYYGLIALGVVPSIIWLLFYLRRDAHPEPKHLVVKAFLLGIIFAPLALILQKAFLGLETYFPGLSIFATGGALFFLWASIVEEFVKFFGIKHTILNDPDFDEPVDGMIYMIASALGFAALENVLIMIKIYPEGIATALGVWLLRFVGATLLHALSSAIAGYFLALAWFYHHHRKKLIVIGVCLASIFHFLFNLFQSHISNEVVALSYTLALLMVMAFLVSVLFDKIKERNRSHQTTLA